MNWVHVQNLVQAHMLAAEALTMAKGYVAVSVLRHPGPHPYSPHPCRLQARRIRPQESQGHWVGQKLQRG